MIYLSLGFVAGFAASWFGKDWLIVKWKGAEKFAQDLQAKADAVKKAIG